MVRSVSSRRACSELERAILQHDPSLDLPAPSRKALVLRQGRRRTLAAIAGLLIATAAALALVLSSRDSAHSVTVSNNSVAIVDPRTNRVIDDIVTGDYPGPLAAGDGSIWVGNIGDNTMMAINASTRKPGFAVAIQQPVDFAISSGKLWIANGTSFASGYPVG
jgi:DNA-binding beta-propeller fold protein YncE